MSQVVKYQPHITTIDDMIAFGRFGYTGAILNLDNDGQKTYQTKTSGVSDEIRESLRILIVGVESDFERTTLMSFGKLTTDVATGVMNLDYVAGAGYPFHLKYSKIQEIDTDAGDFVNMRRRGDKTWQPLNSGWWMDVDKGILYVENYHVPFGLFMLRIGYRYGIETDDGSYEDVKLAILQKSLSTMYGTDTGKAIFESNNWIVPPQTSLDAYDMYYEKCVANRRNLVFIR